MNKNLIPFATAHSVYEVDAAFYRKLGLKAIVCDLDNTLDAYDVAEPSKEALELKKRLDGEGIRLYIGSNNTSKRVKRYARLLGVSCASGLLKPFAFRLRKFLRKEGLEPDEVLMIGDQVYTDTKAANRAGVRILLTEPLTERDPWLSYWNRRLEKRIRKKIEERALAPSWKEKL